jgi:hypothetical protein
MSKQQNRPLTASEQAFADAMVTFSEAVERCRAAGEKVKAEGGDGQYAVLTTVDDPSEKQMLANSWPMVSMMFGL